MIFIRLVRGLLSALFMLFSGIYIHLSAQYIGGTDLAAPIPLWYAAGFLGYLPLHAAFKRLIVMHVFSHELTHALWSVLFGGQVQEMYVSRRRGGFTRYTKGNFVVSLAPYFFPLYALVSLGIFFIVQERFQPVLAALCGFSSCFHVLLTIYSIGIGQPDLKKEGTVFSLSFILMMNALILSVIFLSLADVSLVDDYLADGLRNLCSLIAGAAGYATSLRSLFG
ncbi:MAG: M50 family metallopeptidase [bacterium]